MRPGWALRSEMKARARKDTPADREWRDIQASAGKLAIDDRRERFPVLTAENADAAIRYQEERIAFYLGQLGRGQ